MLFDMNRKTRVLVIGANGQLGAVLIGALQLLMPPIN